MEKDGIKITSAYPERMVNVCKKGWAAVKKCIIVLVIAAISGGFTLAGKAVDNIKYGRRRRRRRRR